VKYRVVKRFTWTGRDPAVLPGALIDISNKATADLLIEKGYLTLPGLSWNDPTGGKVGSPTPPLAKIKRIGIWLKTTRYYSGGRVHMFQYAHAMASAGAQVFLVTNDYPSWASDYPPNQNLSVLLYGTDPVPPDLDIVMTDSKEELGRAALEYKRLHPRSRFFCMNFETPNWVAKFDQAYSEKMVDNKAVTRYADVLMANSHLSAQYLKEWLGPDFFDREVAVLPPAVNDYAITNEMPESQIDRPYAVYSARRAEYKGLDLVVDSIFGLDKPFDLVVFGSRGVGFPSDPKHKVWHLQGHNDETKFRMMANAHFTLAPSLFEGYGMVPGESLAVGTPCIAYDLPVLREAYGDPPPRGLFLVEWNNKDAFLERVENLVVKPKLKMETRASVTRQSHGMKQMGVRVEALPYHQVTTKRVSVQMLAYWGFLPASLESVYPHVDEILIAYGRVPDAKPFDDGTLERLQQFPDPQNKIKLEVRDVWPGGKLEMRTWCCDNATGNYMLVLDGDEIWDGLKDWIDSDLSFCSPRWVNFWHNRKHWNYNLPGPSHARWGQKMSWGIGATCPHYRWSYWRPTYKFATHCTPTDAGGHSLHSRLLTGPEEQPLTIMYHLGHALPGTLMVAKHAFYCRRDGAAHTDFRRAWWDWLKNPVLGDCGDGVVAQVDWELPPLVHEAFDQMESLTGL